MASGKKPVFPDGSSRHLPSPARSPVTRGGPVKSATDAPLVEQCRVVPWQADLGVLSRRGHWTTLVFAFSDSAEGTEPP